MKKIIGLTSGSLALLIIPSLAFAQTAQSLCPSNFANLCNIQVGPAIGSLINFAYLVAIIAALFYLIWGGFKWLTSGGDKAAVQIARDHLASAIIGLVIIFLSYLILNFIIGFFLGMKLSSITIPTFGK